MQTISTIKKNSLRFRKWDLQKAFWFIIKVQLDSNFVLTVH